jgi:uncharacterized membrane protein YdbT with pleckstrin-like domain
MNYQWDKILAPEETVQREFGISQRYRKIVLVGDVILTIIIFTQSLLPGLVVFLLGLLYWWYMSVAKHYAFTNKRVILVESFITKNIVSIDYGQITDIEIDQNAFDQMGGWGTISINTAGTHAPEINLAFIDNPQSIKQSLDQIRDKKTS